MKISNFRNYRQFVGDRYEFAFADVDVTTGNLWWKKTETRPVAKAANIWRFEDDGEFCKGSKIDHMEAAFRMQRLREMCEEGKLQP